MILGLAIDGVGSTAVESLANEVCRDIELKAASEGFQTTIPLSPGMVGWGLEEGQPIIFDLLETDQIGVTFNSFLSDDSPEITFDDYWCWAAYHFR